MKRCLRCETKFSGASWLCPGCGWQPQTVDGFPAFAPALAQGAAHYDARFHDQLHELESGNFWFRARNRLIVWALARYFPGARSMLEIGCGTGYVLAGIAAARPALELAASEAASRGLAFAARRVPRAALLQMDAHAIPFEGEFDVVGAFDVLEHIEDDGAVLAQMRRACRAGIVLTVPQHPRLWSAADDQAGHRRRYTAAELRAKVEAAGFRVRRMTSFVSLLLPAMALSRRRGGERYDLEAELRLPAALNAFFGGVLAVERWLIRAGVSFPAGGSLLLAAERG